MLLSGIYVGEPLDSRLNHEGMTCDMRQWFFPPFGTASFKRQRVQAVPVKKLLTKCDDTNVEAIYEFSIVPRNPGTEKERMDKGMKRNRSIKVKTTCSTPLLAQVILIGIALVLLNYGTTIAQTTTLDYSFGDSGTVRVPIISGGYRDNATSVAIQPDGKIILAGYTLSSSNYQMFALARLNVDGTLDSTFGTDGTVSVTPNGVSSYGYSVALLPGGKILLGGFSEDMSSYSITFALARFDSEGALDPSFGTGGIALARITGDAQYPDDKAYSMAIQSDGKIVLAGSSVDSSYHYAFAVARFDTGGILDSTFGTNGTVRNFIVGGDSTDDKAYSVAIQPNGKIVVAGSSHRGGHYPADTYALARYNANGTLDSTFGTDGTVEMGYANGFAGLVNSAALLPDGKILVAGQNGVARFDSSGTLDSTFGYAGIALNGLTSAAAYINESSMGVQSDGKILLVGNLQEASSQFVFAAVRFTASGTLDSTFGTNGIMTTPFYGNGGWASLNGGYNSYATSTAFQSDGKIVFAGSSSGPSTKWGSEQWFAAARYVVTSGVPPASQLTVDSTSPANDAVNVPLRTHLSITFSAPLDTSIHLDKGLPLFMFTNVDSADSVGWSNNVRTLNVVAYLQPNTVYAVGIFGAFGLGGLRLQSPYIVRFTTGSQFPSDSVSGTVVSGTTGVSGDSAIVGLTMVPNLGHLASIPPLIAVTVADSSGNFVLPGVPNGTYYPVAAKDVDGDGVINPLTGKDVFAVGTPVVVNNASVTEVVLTWTSLKPVNWKQGLSISDSLFLSLPPHSQIRFVSGLGVDTSGNSMEWVTGVTNSLTKSGFLVTAGAVSTILPMDSTIYDSLSAFTAFSPDSAANAGVFVSNAENAGGRTFLQQYNASTGDSVYLLLYLGQLRRTQLGPIVPDSGLYWGAQYVALNPKTMPPATTALFIGDFRTGAILVATGVKDMTETIPKSYALYQNYPNPFNPTTVISYQLSAVSNVTLRVYNVLGQEVTTLVNERQNPGSYTITFNAGNLPSGVYFYRLTAGKFMSVKKLMLLK